VRTIKSKSYYEFEKQPRLMKAAFWLLIVKTKTLRHFRPLLDPKHWTETELRWVVTQLVQHYDEHRKAPDFPTLRMRLDADRNLKEDTYEIIERFINLLDDEIPELEPPVREFVEANFEPFIRYRATLWAIREAQSYVQEGDLDRAVEVVEESQMVRLTEEDRFDLPVDLRQFWELNNPENINAITVPTGIKPLDERIGGGLREGELGVWLAPWGVGKSMALIHCGAEAFRSGRTVVHFTFENSKEETLFRYAYNLLETDSETLPTRRPEDSPFVANLLEEMMANENRHIFVYEMPAGRTSANDLYAVLERIQTDEDVNVGAVIVDYGDLMRPTVLGEKKYENLETVFTELRVLAAELDVPVWTATQANREGAKAQIVRSVHTAGSLGQVKVADVVISITRPGKDKSGRIIATWDEEDEDTIQEDDVIERMLCLDKLRRSGSDNWVLRVKADFGKARFTKPDDVLTDEETVEAWNEKVEENKKRRRKVSEED